MEVYEWDILQCVNTCDAFLGIYGNQSDGRGYETGTAIARDIPMIGIALKSDKVSKVITGVFEYHGKPFIFVDSLTNDVPALVLKHLGLPLGVL